MASVGAVVVVAVVASRVVVPLFIPRHPLPAILAALILDGIDETVFTSVLPAADWARIAGSYRAYDQALDVYYLTVAYTATMRNWTNVSALRWAEGLWLYRLAGVATFGALHAALVAFLWVVVKLPQEWWIHVARLDFTDVAAEHVWVWPTLGALVVVALPALWWVVTHRLPPADRPVRLAADPLPEVLDTEKKRAAYRAATWRVVDTNLLVKVVLISLTCVIFGELLPRNSASPAQLALVVSLVVVVDAAVSPALSRRKKTVEWVPVDVLAVAALNAVVLVVLRVISPRFVLDHALFFALLISLIVVLYDRYRPLRDHRIAEAAAGR